MQMFREIFVWITGMGTEGDKSRKQIFYNIRTEWCGEGCRKRKRGAQWRSVIFTWLYQPIYSFIPAERRPPPAWSVLFYSVQFGAIHCTPLIFSIQSLHYVIWCTSASSKAIFRLLACNYCCPLFLLHVRPSSISVYWFGPNCEGILFSAVWSICFSHCPFWLWQDWIFSWPCVVIIAPLTLLEMQTMLEPSSSYHHFCSNFLSLSFSSFLGITWSCFDFWVYCISPNVGRYFGLVTGPPAMEAMEAAAAAMERFRRLLLTKSKDFVSILITSGLCLFVCVFVCLCVCLFVCLFVCRHDNSRTEEATNVKLHHVIQEGDG